MTLNIYWGLAPGPEVFKASGVLKCGYLRAELLTVKSFLAQFPLSRPTDSGDEAKD